MTRALLIVTMEPPPGLAEEFDDWYDTEHFPQRARLPGFESASRWVCLDGWPRWIAVYDMTSAAAVTTPEYKAVSGANSTPWSKRVLARTIGRQRHVAVAVGDQPSLQAQGPAVSRLLAAEWACPQGEVASFARALRRTAGDLPGAVQVRVFAVDKGETALVWLFVTFDAPVVRADLGPVARVEGRGARTFNLYAPYFRTSGY
ncbi:hypothetical protein PQJ75_10925 [Rhodoplanes sp. TEM]|uniref:Uncharacterized protein n=1 Tax=Rhodoplanes tepidamans TaxID=200616 RepID=A0ABT5JCG4_RHOTP|nr:MULTISPECIES: DUF4286 family protein [Rhodoplanes]MDC7787192.1 hypothetical protein [Rhodoplanes tepidamans]MDC7984244.1 hypothetical protein [Rhodoplanes sp. TEM]MDQ0356041.1 hypothetical protein [Rhodoplanes tepidamans]